MQSLITRKSPRYWTPEQDQILIDGIKNGLKLIGVSKILGKSRRSCFARGKLLGIENNSTRRSYEHDEDFWKVPNMVNCYHAGFLSADGSIRFNKKNPDGCTVTLSLSVDDIVQIHQFIKDTKAEGKINYHKKLTKKGNLSEMARISINSRGRWGIDLKEKFNIVPNKTHRLAPPNIIGEFLNWVFLIGYLDGDGCIFLAKRKFFTIGFVSSSHEIINWILKMFNSRFADKTLKQGRANHVRPSGTYSRLWISGMRAWVLYDFLLKFPVPKLARKWQNPAILNELNDQKSLHPEFFSQNEPLFQSLLSQFQSQSVSNIEGNLCQKN